MIAGTVGEDRLSGREGLDTARSIFELVGNRYQCAFELAENFY